MEIEITTIDVREDYRVSHDGLLWTESGLAAHLSCNGHSYEPVNFCLPFRFYYEARDLSKRIEEVQKARVNRDKFKSTVRV